MISLQTADNALKDVYLGVVSDQLNTGTNPLLAKINQTTSDVWGNNIIKCAPYGVNGGIGAGSETGDLPVAGGNNYEKFTLELKNLYGKIEISDKAIRASMNSAGAFVNLLNAEMEGLIKASSFNFGRMLFGDGSGKICKIVDNEVSGSGVTVFTVDSVKALAEGMIVDIIDGSGNIKSSKSAVKITNVDRLNCKVTVLTTGFTANELKVTSSQTTQYYFCIQGSFNKELTGLGAIFDTNLSSLYGLDRASNSWMNPYSYSISSDSTMQSISDVKMQTVIDYLDENYGSAVDFIVCSSGVKRNYQNYLSTYRSNIDVLDLAGGYKAISYNGIPVVSDRFAPSNTMYMLNTKEFKLHQLCDWKWLTGEDGRVIKQNANSPTYSATLVKYADLICDKPCGQAKITGILES
ncbi:MAG: phage major capsid protein [Christensenellales bacterium]